MIMVTFSFRKAPLQKCVRPHQNENAAFSNSSGLTEERFVEKLRYRDGLVWTVGLTVEIKLRFQIRPLDPPERFYFFCKGLIPWLMG